MNTPEVNPSIDVADGKMLSKDTHSPEVVSVEYVSSSDLFNGLEELLETVQGAWGTFGDNEISLTTTDQIISVAENCAESEIETAQLILLEGRVAALADGVYVDLNN